MSQEIIGGKLVQRANCLSRSLVKKQIAKKQTCLNYGLGCARPRLLISFLQETNESNLVVRTNGNWGSVLSAFVLHSYPFSNTKNKAC